MKRKKKCHKHRKLTADDLRFMASFIAEFVVVLGILMVFNYAVIHLILAIL